MSKADQLGSGRFGGGVRTVSARRQAVAAATGVPTEGIAPPAELPVHRISPNPDNPRSDLGDLTDLAGSLKTHGQKQAITVMNRDAYVKANPEREADLEPDTTHVVVDGSSRLAAAREAGLDTLKVMVSDDQGSTPEELLESALVANIHRQDLNELDEARALERLLEIHGSQRALAKRLHRSQGWVSQRLALLNLSPELQARIGEEPIDLLRAVGNKPVEQQETALEELKAERAAKEEAARTSKRHATQRTAAAREEDTPGQPAGDYGVITGSAEEDSSTNSQDESPSRDGEPSQSPAASDTIPEPRADSRSPRGKNASLEQQARRVPFDRPGELALLLDVRVETDDAFFTLLELLTSKALDRDPARAGELARSFAEAAARAG
ncbi:ParB/RepB/Spo0J family partition protein [Streptomyces sp. DH10]|uniref:ParB/RepB/Spo0J family partition protein n=1 Tax=Streptomyces sp. DH10 TaxID=3040121 RepID=UPI0024420F6B|nr:ParB/RepB/Spo0J family partition protein [Streptomyces sp. DH10]MDG9709525.1 ParB/RepB/Spo0J family partition protein [Streptomyces sp. DH10]